MNSDRIHLLVRDVFICCLSMPAAIVRLLSVRLPFMPQNDRWVLEKMMR